MFTVWIEISEGEHLGHMFDYVYSQIFSQLSLTDALQKHSNARSTDSDPVKQQWNHNKSTLLMSHFSCDRVQAD